VIDRRLARRRKLFLRLAHGVFESGRRNARRA
jgi:hypothetical protein